MGEMKEQLREAAMLMQRADEDEVDRGALERMFKGWPDMPLLSISKKRGTVHRLDPKHGWVIRFCNSTSGEFHTKEPVARNMLTEGSDS